jgi:hypothetical protein
MSKKKTTSSELGYDFLISVGGCPTLVSGAVDDDARKDPAGAVSFWNFGWDHRPEDVSKTVMELAATQLTPMLFGNTEAGADPVDQEKMVCLWDAETKIRGRIMPSWNQGQVGTCVSFGWARGCNDLIRQMEALGIIEAVAEDVATEPIYGGSRVEVGGGRIGGDGSVGAWAAKWVRDWGILMRKSFGSYDLSKYSESVSRSWGKSGCPDPLEPIAKNFPVKAVTMIASADEGWNCIGSGYPVPVCSNQGFTSSYSEGFCDPKGSWGHCMCFRGRVMAKRKSATKKALICQNSWGDYISGTKKFTDAKTGQDVELPPGCFLVEYEIADRMLRSKDSFSVSNLEGFPKRDAFDFIW